MPWGVAILAANFPKTVDWMYQDFNPDTKEMDSATLRPNED